MADDAVKSPADLGAAAASLGWLLGCADEAYGLSVRAKAVPQLQFFGSGWGDMQRYHEFQRASTELLSVYQRQEQIPDVQLGPPQSACGGLVQRGSFEGPLATYLSSESRTCEFEMLIPDGVAVRACILIFPGTGDQTYAFRRHCLAAPLLQHGVASIMPMPPFYGSRKPKSQWFHYISTVSDFMMCGSCLIGESLLLLDWAARRFPGASLGVTGISWGGAMAGVLGFLAKRHTLAVVPLLPSASAAVIVNGALRREVAIGRLSQGKGESLQDLETSLLELFARSDMKEAERVAAEAPGPKGVRSILQVSAVHDSFVTPADGLEVFETFRRWDPEAELNWVTGGHISAHAAARWLFPSHILRALSRLSCKLPPRSRL